MIMDSLASTSRAMLIYVDEFMYDRLCEYYICIISRDDRGAYTVEHVEDGKLVG